MVRLLFYRINLYISVYLIASTSGVHLKLNLLTAEFLIEELYLGVACPLLYENGVAYFGLIDKER
jgi:hypothetical protein